MNIPNPAPCRLYLVTPSVLEPATFRDQLAAALDGGDVACVQLRLKDVGDDEIRRAIDTLMPVATQRDVAFILNDRPDLAHAMGCDGAHVGQKDMPYEAARRLLGPDRIVGVTTAGISPSMPPRPAPTMSPSVPSIRPRRSRRTTARSPSCWNGGTRS